MSAIPRSVKIGPLTYTVEHSHQAIEGYRRTAGEDPYGVCQNRTCRLLIDEGYPLSKERKTVLHEVVHAINAVYDLEGLKADEEHYTGVLSVALLAVLQDNPALVTYLLEVPA